MSSASTDRPQRRRRPWFLVAVICLVLVAALGGFVAARVLGGIGDVGQAQLMPAATPPAAQGTAGIEQAPTRPTRPPAAGDSLNILVVRRGVSEGQATAEDVALVHIDHDRSRVDVVTLDPMLGAGSRSTQRLGEAYQHGGSADLVLDVEQLVQVPVDHAAELNSEGFDALTSLMSSEALTNPLGAQETIDVVTRNLTVDESLSNEKMRDLALRLATTGRPHRHVVKADDPELQRRITALQKALQTDDMASL